MLSLSCPICNSEDTVIPYGPRNASILVIGSKPEKDDLKHSKILSGALGSIFRGEFAFRGIDTRRFRFTSLHIHIPNKNADCLKYSASEVMKEVKDRQLIILVGTEATKYFTGKGAESVNGLQVSCEYFSAPVFCVENPGIMVAKGGVVGEIRSAITKISNYIELKGLQK